MRTHFLGRLAATGTFALLALIIPTVAGAKTLKVPSKYSTIQAAVNAASSGDTIQVSKKSGNAPYKESVTVNTAKLTINADAGVVMDGGGATGIGDGFTVTADNVSISNFTFTNFLMDQTNPAATPRTSIHEFNVVGATINNINSNGNDEGCLAEETLNLAITNSSFTNNLQEGIRVVDATSPTITGNIISGNANGAGFFYGVVMLIVSGGSFSLNSLTSNANGLSLETAAQGPNPPGVPAPLPVSVTANYVANNQGESITIDGCYLVTVSLNIVSNNLFGIGFIDACLQCTASYNLVTGTSLVGSGNAGIIVTDGSTAIVVSHNDVENNLSDGIDVLGAIGNTITYNISKHNTSAGSVDATDDTFVLAPNLNTWAHNIFGVTNPPGLD